MEKSFLQYVGISFVIICITYLVIIITTSGYSLHINKKNIDISPSKTNINSNEVKTSN